MKNQPQRMCVVCRTHQDKNMLTRVVRLPDGTVVIDSTSKLEGRGAYVCKNATCVAKCKKTKILNKHLDCEVSQEILDNLPTSL